VWGGGIANAKPLTVSLEQSQPVKLEAALAGAVGCLSVRPPFFDPDFRTASFHSAHDFEKFSWRPTAVLLTRSIQPHGRRSLFAAGIPSAPVTDRYMIARVPSPPVPGRAAECVDVSNARSVQALPAVARLVGFAACPCVRPQRCAIFLIGTMWKPQRVLNRENPKKLLQQRDV